MNHWSPNQSPGTTGRFSALPSAPITQTKWPLEPCCTALCGTRIAFGRRAPFMRARTYWLGRSTAFGLAKLARSRNVPVCGLNEGSAKVILPVCGNVVPSTSTSSTT